jgi:hypothetical protein
MASFWICNETFLIQKYLQKLKKCIHISKQTWERNHDLIDVYSRIFTKCNPINLSHLINSYIKSVEKFLKTFVDGSLYFIDFLDFKAEPIWVFFEMTSKMNHM